MGGKETPRAALVPELCAEDGSLALREIRKMWPRKSWRKGPQEERRAGVSWFLRHLSSPPHARLQCLTGWDRGTGSLFLPQNIWGCIRHNDLVKKIVMEICNRETLSKASLKFLFNPQPGGGDWKLENWETITGPSKWSKFNPICRFKDG